MEKLSVKQELKRLDARINEIRPNTEDELIKIIDGQTSEKYGFCIMPVYFLGYLQGVRVAITPKSKTHFLPSDTKVYSIFDIFKTERLEIHKGF